MQYSAGITFRLSNFFPSQKPSQCIILLVYICSLLLCYCLGPCKLHTLKKVTYNTEQNYLLNWWEILSLIILSPVFKKYNNLNVSDVIKHKVVAFNVQGFSKYSARFSLWILWFTYPWVQYILDIVLTIQNYYTCLSLLNKISGQLCWACYMECHLKLINNSSVSFHLYFKCNLKNYLLTDYFELSVLCLRPLKVFFSSICSFS